MKYFSSNLFSNIDYTFENQDVLLRDIFKNYDIKDISDTYLKLERIYANETLHLISYRLYNTLDYWWLLAKINNLRDTFDVYYNDEIFMSKANLEAVNYFQEKSLSYTTQEFNTKYLEYYNNLKDNQITTLLIIDNKYLDDVIYKIIEERG